MIYLSNAVIFIATPNHLKGIKMGTSRKHARKVARKAVKENRAFRGRRVD